MPFITWFGVDVESQATPKNRPFRVKKTYPEILGRRKRQKRIVDPAVARGLVSRSTEGITRVGLDERSFARGRDYVSLMTDVSEKRVLEAVPGGDTESAPALWQADPRDFRSFSNHRIRILFFCGKLQLHPRIPTPTHPIH